MTCWDGPCASPPWVHAKRSSLQGGEIRHKSAGMKTSYPYQLYTLDAWCLHILAFTLLFSRFCRDIRCFLLYRNHNLLCKLYTMPILILAIIRERLVKRNVVFHHPIIWDDSWLIFMFFPHIFKGFQKQESLKNIKKIILLLLSWSVLTWNRLFFKIFIIELLGLYYWLWLQCRTANRV